LSIIIFRGLKNKCNSNAKLYNLTEISESISNYTQQLNSTLVDPSNVPEFDEKNSNSTSDDDNSHSTSKKQMNLKGHGLLPDSNNNSTMSGDNVKLEPTVANGAGMDASENILDSFIQKYFK
jgi:hypothetical protein